MIWHIVTCEYPPQIGGVSDYTRHLARQLELAGDQIHIWGPSFANEAPETKDGGAFVHRTLGDFSKSNFTETENLIQQACPNRPRTFLVQWVPHGFGKRAMNLAFCHWLEKLHRNGDHVELMVHEPYLSSDQGSWKQRLVARVHRRMIRIVLEAASRVYISIPAWERYLRPYAPSDLEMTWLPIPATIPVTPNANATLIVRRRMGERKLVVGHLGTYSVAIRNVIGPALVSILRAVPNANVLLLGNGGETFAQSLRAWATDVESRIQATGHLPDEKLSHHLSACDLMLQPFPDGLSSRRTSLMNALSHGVAVVSNTGHLTEEVWEDSQAVVLGATGTAPDLAAAAIELLRDNAKRRSIAETGANLYRSRFDWPHVMAILRSSPDLASAVSQK